MTRTPQLAPQPAAPRTRRSPIQVDRRAVPISEHLPEAEQRRLRLYRLHDALTSRGLHSVLAPMPHDRWAIKVPRKRLGRQIVVMCGGCNGLYFYVTAKGVVLGAADDHGADRAAETISTMAA